MSAGRCHFISPIECRHFRFTNYKIFFPQTKITFLVDIFKFDISPFSNLYIFTCNRYCCQLPDDCFIRKHEIKSSNYMFLSQSDSSNSSLYIFITQLYARAHSDWLIFYEKEMDGSQRWFMLTPLSVKFLPAKDFSLNFLRVKLNFSCY